MYGARYHLILSKGLINAPLTPAKSGMKEGEIWQCGSHEVSLRKRDLCHITWGLQGNVDNNRSPEHYLSFSFPSHCLDTFSSQGRWFPLYESCRLLFQIKVAFSEDSGFRLQVC